MKKVPGCRPALFCSSLFTRNQGASLLPCPYCAPLPGQKARHFFTLHYSLFTLTFFVSKAMTCYLVRISAPSSSSPRRRRGAPRGGGEEEALVQTKMDPCFYKIVLYKVASTAEVWYKLDLPQRPHPLARWLGARRSAMRRSHPWLPPAPSGGAGWTRSGQTERGKHQAASCSPSLLPSSLLPLTSAKRAGKPTER